MRCTELACTEPVDSDTTLTLIRDFQFDRPATQDVVSDCVAGLSEVEVR